MIDVKKIAHLARLSIDTHEEKTYQEQLTATIRYFEELASVVTQGVEPLVTPSDVELVFREDAVSVELTAEEALQNAPSRQGNLFKVPPVV